MSYEDIKYKEVKLIWIILFYIFFPSQILPSIIISLFLILALKLLKIQIGSADILLVSGLIFDINNLGLFFLSVGAFSMLAHLLFKQKTLPLIPFIFIGFALDHIVHSHFCF